MFKWLVVLPLVQQTRKLSRLFSSTYIRVVEWRPNYSYHSSLTHLPHQSVSSLGEGYNGWCRPSALTVRHDCRLATLHRCYSRVGRAQVDPHHLFYSRRKLYFRGCPTVSRSPLCHQIAAAPGGITPSAPMDYSPSHNVFLMILTSRHRRNKGFSVGIDQEVRAEKPPAADEVLRGPNLDRVAWARTSCVGTHHPSLPPALHSRDSSLWTYDSSAEAMTKMQRLAIAKNPSGLKLRQLWKKGNQRNADAGFEV